MGRKWPLERFLFSGLQRGLRAPVMPFGGLCCSGPRVLVLRHLGATEFPKFDYGRLLFRFRSYAKGRESFRNCNFVAPKADALSA